MTLRETPARPLADHGFVQLPDNARVIALIGVETHAYQRGPVCVLSSAGMMEYQSVTCPHNHVSVSVLRELGRRPTDAEMDDVRHAFDMVDAEEDNHSPGRIRNLFLPLHLPRGTVGVCDCKSGETTVVEADGFTWSRPSTDLI